MTFSCQPSRPVQRRANGRATVRLSSLARGLQRKRAFPTRNSMSDQDWFTLGVEEEYLLIDRGSKALVADPPPELFTAARCALGPQVSREMMRAQIEVATRKHGRLDTLREDLS